VRDTRQGDRALYRLAYVSDIAPSSIDTLDITLRQILIQSYVLNSRDDITGFLITYRGWYAQALEGPRAEVEACYARIGADRRHARPEVKSRGSVGLRLFPQWSMCGMTLSARDAGVLVLAEQAFNLNLRDASPQALVQFLEAISRRYNGQVDRLYRTLKQV
jgi:hypothetical protein